MRVRDINQVYKAILTALEEKPMTSKEIAQQLSDKQVDGYSYWTNYDLQHLLYNLKKKGQVSGVSLRDQLYRLTGGKYA